MNTPLLANYTCTFKLLFSVIILTLNTACGLQSYKRFVYPQEQQLVDSSEKKDCPLLEDAYVYLVKDKIERSCFDSCHAAGGIGDRVLSFSYDDDFENSKTLLTKMIADVDFFLDKATGRVDHLGGAAMNSDDESVFKRYALMSDVCE